VTDEPALTAAVFKCRIIVLTSSDAAKPVLPKMRYFASGDASIAGALV
jgi:hypothetical protein